MEVEFICNSSIKISVDSNIKIKDIFLDKLSYLNKYNIGEHYNLFVETHKINETEINETIENIISKYQSNSFKLIPTKQYHTELENLIERINLKEDKIIALKDAKAKLAKETVSKITSKDVFDKKFSSLTKDLETIPIIQKLLAKLIKCVKNFEILFTDSESFANEITFRCQNYIPFYLRIIEICLQDVYNFIYKYCIVFVDNFDIMSLLAESFIDNYKTIINKIDIYINNKIKEDSLKPPTEEVQKVIKDKIMLDLIFIKCTRYNESRTQNEIYLKHEEPIYVNLSKQEYKEIKLLLSQFPSYSYLVSKHPEAMVDEVNWNCMILVLQRDIKIYDFYGIKMNEFNHGILLYEN